jgi:hypothetical protein
MADNFDVEALLDGPQPEAKEGELFDEDDAFVYDESSKNLAFDFDEHPEGREAKRKLADFIVQEYDAARDANKEYLDRCARDWRIFSGDLSPKSAPFKDAANAHVPIMLENLSRLAFRAKDELFGDWTNVVSMKPTGPDDNDLADILSRHLNWQLPQLPGMIREQDRGMLIFFTFGEVASHSYYDERLLMNRHEILSPEQVTTPYVYVSTALDYSDCPWVAKMMMLYKHELEAARDAYFDVERVLDAKPPQWADEPEKRISEALAEARGISMDENRPESSPYQLIWWEGWADLPSQETQRYCQVILEYRSRHVLKMTIHEHEEWRDRLRYERQMSELNAWRQAKAAHAQAMDQQVGMLETQADAILSGGVASQLGPEAEFAALQGLQSAAGQPLPPPPAPPGWLLDPEAPEASARLPRKVPIHMFAHTACIEPLQGNLGLGYGRIEGDYNRAANTALCQFTDQATLSNCQTLITTADVQFKEPFGVGPGKVNVLSNFSGNIRDAMFPLQFSQANNQLLELVKEFRAYGQAATQVSEVISGFPGKSGEPFKGLAARLEQATKALSVPTRKYASFFEQIVKNNCHLNSIFLDNEELFTVANDLIPGSTIQQRVTRDMYRRSYDVTVKADLRFTSQAQRIQEADEVVQMVNSNPALASNPALVYAAYKEAFEARGKRNMAALMGPPPIPGAPPPMQPGMPGANPGGPAVPPNGGGGGQSARPPNSNPQESRQ